MPLQRAIFLLIFAAAGWLHAREDKPDKKKDDVNWKEPARPGAAVQLRVKRPVGKSLIYEGSIDRTQDASTWYHETGSFYLNVLCADRTENLDQIAIWRTYLDRKRSEKFENGKKTDRILENSNDLINLGPNFSIVGNLRCYAFDAQNRVAYRTEQMLTLKDGRMLYGRVLSEDNDQLVFLTDVDKFDLKRADVDAIKPIPLPHVCMNEAPHYLFPIFSGRKVAPGETWKFKVPVIMPVEQGIGGRVLPSQFNASLIGRLREVRDGNIAIVDYQVSGEFNSDADEFAPRFSADFRDNNRLIHTINGEGALSLDIEKGRILEKSEVFHFMLYAKSVVPQGGDKPPKAEENKSEITSRFDMKLLPPGTRLKSGAVVPEYD